MKDHFFKKLFIEHGEKHSAVIKYDLCLVNLSLCFNYVGIDQNCDNRAIIEVIPNSFAIESQEERLSSAQLANDFVIEYTAATSEVTGPVLR